MVPVIEGEIATKEISHSTIAGLDINMFMIKLINEFNVLPKGTVITKEDLMFEKNLYEISVDLHSSFLEYGFNNSAEILSEESSHFSSYLHYLPFELINTVKKYLTYLPVNEIS